MEPTSEQSFLKGTLQERILVAVATPLLSVLCVGGLIATEARFGTPSGSSRSERFFDFLWKLTFSELFVAALLILAVAFVWACVRPKWAERTLNYLANHFFHVMCLFIVGFVLTVAIAGIASRN
jgi:hypothetical protein